MGSGGAAARYSFCEAEGNRREAVVEDISHILFPRLVHLNITGNNIQSIETLPRMFMPHLSRLFLSTGWSIQAPTTLLRWAWRGMRTGLRSCTSAYVIVALFSEQQHPWHGRCLPGLFPGPVLVLGLLRHRAVSRPAVRCQAADVCSPPNLYFLLNSAIGASSFATARAIKPRLQAKWQGLDISWISPEYLQHHLFPHFLIPVNHRKIQ